MTRAYALLFLLLIAPAARATWDYEGYGLANSTFCASDASTHPWPTDDTTPAATGTPMSLLPALLPMMLPVLKPTATFLLATLWTNMQSCWAAPSERRCVQEEQVMILELNDYLKQKSSFMTKVVEVLKEPLYEKILAYLEISPGSWPAQKAYDRWVPQVTSKVSSTLSDAWDGSLEHVDEEHNRALLAVGVLFEKLPKTLEEFSMFDDDLKFFSRTEAIYIIREAMAHTRFTLPVC